MTFDWIGEGFSFGQRVSFFQITIDNVQLVYSIHKTTQFSDGPFAIERVSKNIKQVNIQEELEEEVNKVYITHTDDHFRKKFKRSYSLIKFVTDDTVITVGGYTDNDKRMTASNVYLLCGRDFVNILAKTEEITHIKQLDNTAFESLKPIFDKKELAKELLRD